jgi:LPS export ABC transporter protein LptC
MYLTKKQSFFIAGGILAAFFIVVFILVRHDGNSRSRPAPQQTGEAPAASLAPAATRTIDDTLGSAQFSLKDFQRSATKDGQKSWEVRAALGEYFPDKQALRLTTATLLTFRKNGDVVKMTSQKVTVYLQGTTITTAEAEGNVTVVFNEKMTVRTERALYDQQKNLVTAPGHASITGELFDISGEGLELNTDKKTAALKHNVKTVIRRGVHGLAKYK